ncbi:Isoamyl acetate-hydrolyzing esterase 1 -like protein [Halotydeus destructor]|nr:Isoamyl acetate-hydrolyzing esterase 1 -like protein [Halotydeus destructor]
MSWSKVILFGDSLTEWSHSPDGQWASLLADKLKRVADIVVRGFGGYNSRWGLLMLPKLFPETFSFDDVSCFVICLGCNDASAPECPYGLYVPIDEYKLNLKAIVDFLVGRGLSKDKIVFMTTPTFSQAKWDLYVSTMETNDDLNLGPMVRTDEDAGQYARACVETGHEIQVDTLNLHEAFTRDPRGDALLGDGVHFSPEGCKVLVDHLWPLIEPKVLKHAGTEALTVQFPDWSAVTRSDPRSCF